MPARVTQTVVEVLSRAAAPVRVTQALVETLNQQAQPAFLTQAVAEILSWTNGPSRLRVTQALVEVLWRAGEVAPCEPLPRWIAYGATGGPEWGTAVFQAPGGWEQRAQQWAQVRGRWDVSFLNRTREETATLVAFFRAVAHGRAQSFCFVDWRDHTFANQIATGDASTSVFQLGKVYTSGSLSYTRPLTRPVLGSLEVRLNGVVTADYTVDTLSGRLSFPSAPATGVAIFATGEFEVLVRFDTDHLTVTCVAPDLFHCAGLGLVELIGE